MNTLTYTAYALECLCLLAGLIKLNQRRYEIVKYFVLMIAVNVVMETTFLFIIKDTINLEYYNLLSCFNFNLVFLLIFKNIGSHKAKVKVGAIVYNILFFANLVHIQFNSELTTYANIVGGVLVSVFVIFYYIELLSSNLVLYIKNDLFYWFSIGALLYYSGSIPFELVINDVSANDSNIVYINHVLYIIYYLCITVGFFMHKPQTVS